jgi:hypothetical protein
MIASALSLVNFAHVDLFGDLWAILTGYAAIIDNDLLLGIELVRRQYSGKAQGLTKGIGTVNCMYANPLTQEYWPHPRHEGFESVNRPGYWFQLLL